MVEREGGCGCRCQEGGWKNKGNIEIVESELKTDALNPSATDLTVPLNSFIFILTFHITSEDINVFIQHGFIHIRLSHTFYQIIRQ